MTPTRNQTTAMLSAFLFAVAAASAVAEPTQIRHLDEPNHCDTLVMPLDGNVDELGDGAIFPNDERIGYLDRGDSNHVPCPNHDDTLIPNTDVSIFNGTGRDFAQVWYIADPETKISNFDGYANDINFPVTQGNYPAFRIDNDISDPGGIHHPLIFESLTADGIFENGEEWRFTLQDYTNSLGISAAAFTSFGAGQGSADVAGFQMSSGSIVAVPVPEPTAVLLALVGIGALAARRQ